MFDLDQVKGVRIMTDEVISIDNQYIDHVKEAVYL